MVKCCIVGCKSSSKHTLVQGVRLHRFPTKNQALRRSWIRFALLSGTKLSKLDITDRNNTRICSHHFIDMNRDANPEPAVLPQGRQLETPPAGSGEALYITDMEMEDQRESGGSYTFPTDVGIDLEAFIDAKLAEMDVATLFEKATEKLDVKLRQQERKTREVNQIFTHCENQLKQFKHNIEMDQGIMDKTEIEAAAGADADSDDDVQIVQTAYEPHLVNRRPQQRMQPYPQRFQGAPRAGIPQGMQQNFTMRSGALVRQPLQQASGGVRQQYMASPVSQSFPRPPNPASRFSAPQVQGQRALVSNKSPQGGPRMPGEQPLTVTQRRPNTTMNAPPTKHADLVVGMKLFGKKFNDIWYKGTLVEIHDKDKPRSEWRYRIKFDSKGLKVLPGRQIAFIDSPTDTLPVGSRVVALYKDEDSSANTAHYAGIVSESPSLRNSQRYLIFFDDGYAQYCASKEIHKVYEQSRNVWEDIHPDSQEFIKSYLKQYPERPMVRLQSNQIIKTEWNGRWWTARVLVTDASLVKMYFDADKRVEWIYRGSTRLEPLYTELTNAEISKASGKGHRRHNLGMKSNKKPIVEYLRGTDEDFMRRKQPQLNKPQAHPPAPPAAPPMTMQRSLSADSVSTIASSINKKRHVARKSTGKPQPEIPPERPPVMERRQFQTSSISRHSIDRSRDLIQDRLTSEFIAELNDGEGLGERMAIDTGWKDSVRKTYYPHRCRSNCLNGTELDPGKFRGYNPLIIPMLCGWERQISKQKNTGKRAVFYRGPCARRMRTLAETEQYLKDTDAMITIDMFCYDAMLHTHSEFVPIKTFCDIKDLSYGKETVRISCVNGIDRQYPDYVEYSNQRIPAEGVHLNLDPDFLVGCNCTDRCGDPETCSCAKLTLEASRVIPGPKPETLGYQHRRLMEPVVSGIYECNQRCKCSSRCCNRVAQNGLQLRLQVFKTEKRGWGLRSLDDIPAGGFICVYAGQLLTEQGANEDGQQYGDEYLAELDYIEVVERGKDGYESDVDINIDDEGIGQDRSRSGDDDEDDAADNYNAPSDSDSTFSGEKYLTSINLTGTPERKSNRKRTKKVQDGEKDKGEKKSTKIVIKRGADQDKSWSVKVKSPQAKTKEWVDSIPDPPTQMTIVISDEEDASGSKAEKSKGSDKKPEVKTDIEDTKTDKKSESENPESDKSEQKPKDEDKEKEKKEKIAKEEVIEGRDSDLDSCGEKKLEKPKMTSPSKVTMNLKSTFMSEVHIDEASIDPTRRPIRVPRIRERGIGCTNSDKDKDTAEAKAESGEPIASGSKSHAEGETPKKETNDSSDSSQDGIKKQEKEKTSKAANKDVASNNSKGGSGEGSDKSNNQARNRSSRFSGLPDPKSQQVISPIKIKLMKEAAEKKEAAAKKKEKKPVVVTEDEEDHGFKTRLLYNNEDFCYVMDAKSMGNLGRYLNHNCAPNVFVQNVFVDTHDMRFPWVAFFAGQYIRAGTELTWDYNYEVGSVPGKVLYCYCGAAECRGRLL